MNQNINDTEMQTNKKGKRPFSVADIVVVAVIVVLVLLLLFMGRRTCSVTLPSDISDGAEWAELWNDGQVVKLTDEGYTSETEYTFKYKAGKTKSTVTVVYVYLDKDTGDEMDERIAYTFTTDAFGFITAQQAGVPGEQNTQTVADTEVTE
ncbi:MAG: hypothetical protein E7661_09475 [Ruminococcaceae bacterium]|nr:hypothetical protein [Oscillospiraceae bacterium]